MHYFQILSTQSQGSRASRGFKAFSKLIATLWLGSIPSLIATDLRAQEESQPAAATRVENLTLRHALALTLEGSPELRVFEHDIRAAEARILQAGLPPNPSVDVELENFAGNGVFGGTNGAETTVSLGQLIELGGKRRARTYLARSSRDVGLFDYEEKKREVLVKTTELFIEVLKVQRRVEVSGKVLELTKGFEPAIQKRIEAGKGRPLEATKSKIAISSATIELEQARQALASARIMLSAQWGVTEPHFARASGEFENLEAVASLQELSGRLGTNPRLLRYEAEVQRAEAALRLAEAAGKPDVKLWGGVRQHNVSDDTAVVVGVSVPLPLFNRNQGEIRAASEELNKLGTQRALESVRLNAALAEAYQQLSGSRTQIDVLRNEFLPSAETAQKQAEEGYQAGLFGYLEVLDAQRTLNSARLQLIQSFSEYRQALAQIEGLIGVTGLNSNSAE